MLGNKHRWIRRAFASSGVILAVFTLITVFQNCSGLDSPNSGSSDASSYAAHVVISNVSVNPGQVANVLVVLDRPLSSNVTVSYQTVSESATAGVHFQSMSSSVDLPAGQTTFQIAINTLVTSGADYNNKRFIVDVSFAGNVAPHTVAYISFTGGSSPSSLTPFQKSGNLGLLSTGEYHTCALKNDQLYCWGRNTEGQLGQGNNTNRLTAGLVAAMDVGVQAVSAGRMHTCAIKAGALYCWGLNSTFQLGNGNATSSNFATAVFDMGAGVQAVSAGYDHTCAIKNGGLYCWGANGNAQVGHNNGVTQAVPLLVTNFATGVTAVAAGLQYTCAIKNGGLYCWGRNSEGQLALGNATNDNTRTPGAPGVTIAPVAGFTTGVIAISTNDRSTCATKGNGALYCWGYNASSQLGQGNAINTSAPILVSGFDLGIGHIATTVSHTCAIKAAGLFCWGYNGYGQLGLNNTTSSSAPLPTPVTVTLNTGEAFNHISNGGHGDNVNRQSHTCARTNQNRVFCWGYNGMGQVGNNTTVSSLVPVLVAF